MEKTPENFGTITRTSDGRWHYAAVSPDGAPILMSADCPEGPWTATDVPKPSDITPNLN